MGLLIVHKDTITKFIYHYQQEWAQSFTQLPNFLFEAPTYQPLSNEAKLLYAFILRRADLSRKNGWADECGRIYLYHPICEVVGLLHCGRQKAINTLRELQYAELIDIKKQMRAVPIPNFLKYLNWNVYRNTEIKMIYLYRFQSYQSYFQRDFPCGKPRKGWGRNGERSLWHNTQFCDLKNTRAIRQGRWKPIMKDRKSSTPAIRTLTPAAASTTSTSSSRRDAITTLFKTALNR